MAVRNVMPVIWKLTATKLVGVTCSKTIPSAHAPAHTTDTDTTNTALHRCIASTGSLHKAYVQPITKPTTAAKLGQISEAKEENCQKLCTTGNEALESSFEKLLTLFKSVELLSRIIVKSI